MTAKMVPSFLTEVEKGWVTDKEPNHGRVVSWDVGKTIIFLRGEFDRSELREMLIMLYQPEQENGRS